MNLTVVEALQRAVEAHKVGNLQEAERLYQAILEVQPTHSDANHNLGVLAVGVGKPEAALPFFKAALQANEQHGQYWVSYINALIQCKQIVNAKELLTQGKRIGLSGDAINQLEQLLEKLLAQEESRQKQKVILSTKKRGSSKKKSKSKKRTLTADLRPNEPSQHEIETLLSQYNAGNFDAAEQQANVLTKKYPNHPFGWKGLGAILLTVGRVEEALVATSEASRLDPKDAETLSNLGVTLYDLGRLNEAEEKYREAIRLKPDHAMAHNNLGNTLRELGRLIEAEESCREAIRLKPDYAEAYTNLGNTLRDLGRLTEAEASQREAIRNKPDYAKAHNSLGATLNDLGRLNEAVASYREAIRLKPEFAEAYSNLGNILRELGRLNEAEASCREAIRLKPEFAQAHLNLAVIKKFYANDKEFTLLEHCYQSAVPTSIDRIYASFALAKAYEDIGRVDEAFDLYLEGNRLNKARLAYDIQQDRDLFHAIKSSFVIRSYRATSNTRNQPIFVLGMPRSGTTLVEQVLASHSNVYGAGELQDMEVAVRTHATTKLIDGLSFNYSQIAIDNVRQSYLSALEALPTDKPFIVDKMPQNFRWIGFMLSAFPEACVINLCRDPVAVCWSIFKTYFPTKGLGFAYDLEDLAEYYKLYKDLMAFWHEKYPGRIYDLQYEQLTENQEEETRKLLDYCGLPWEDACLNFHETERAVRTASATQVRKKMYQGSSDAWKKFEKHLGALRRGLGRTT